MAEPDSQQLMNPSGSNAKPLIQPTLPLTTRISYTIRLILFRNIVTFVIAVHRTLFLRRRATYPTLTKSYAVQPHLTHRIFIPKSHVAGSTLPLYIDMHGGGFAFGSPQDDDVVCSDFAERFGAVIVSLQYPETPAVQFPVPTMQLGDVIQAVLDDESLPIDHSRVAIGGFSAGGNLALSVCQLPQLQGKIHAVVPFYAPCDWTVTTDFKLAGRPYKKPGDRDLLAPMMRIFDYGYVAPGTKLDDPLLSPTHALRSKLPKWVFTISAEFDCLADEARRMMENLAKQEEREVATEEQENWEKGTLRWFLVKDTVHGFTHHPFEMGEKEQKRMNVSDQVFKQLAGWLANGAFAK
jgi:acetyl esterase/lipase